MSNLTIRDLSFMTELDTEEASVAGGAVAGASAAADRSNATAASGSGSRGKLRSSAEGGGFFFGPLSTVEVKEYRRRPLW